MLQKLGMKTLALAAALAAAVPGVTLARDHDNFRGRGPEHHEVYRGDWGHRDRDWDHDRGRWGFGFGVYTAPTPVPVPVPSPAANGYYDQYGVWHPYNPYYSYPAPSPYGY